MDVLSNMIVQEAKEALKQFDKLAGNTLKSQ